MLVVVAWRVLTAILKLSVVTCMGSGISEVGSVLMVTSVIMCAEVGVSPSVTTVLSDLNCSAGITAAVRRNKV